MDLTQEHGVYLQKLSCFDLPLVHKEKGWENAEVSVAIGIVFRPNPAVMSFDDGTRLV